MMLPFVSCTESDEEMDSTAYQIGTPTLEAASPGNERVQITWKPNDNEVEGSYIFWNDGQDSEYVYFPAGSDQATATIAMEAGKYVFYVQNVMEDGSLSSASGSLTANVYDSDLVSVYELCPILSTSYLDGEGGAITWGDATNCVGNMVYYTDLEGNEYQRYCPMEEGTSYFEEAALNGEFTYVSYYVPVTGGIDSLATEPSDGTEEYSSFTMPDGEPFIVKSIDAMVPYLSRDNVWVQLVEGEYNLGPDDAKNKEIYQTIVQTRDDPVYLHHVMLPVTGSYSTYDFNNSTIYYDNNVMNTLGYEFYNMHIQGNYTTIKNLTIQDVGDFECIPAENSTKIVLDGRHNTLENVAANAKGSYPWGYGELFGKGTGPVIAMYKNGGILVRGEYNTLDGCSVTQQSICHTIFFQGAQYPTVKNTKVMGMMITTDEVLDDKRSMYDAGSNGKQRAYDVGYVTDFWDDRACPYSSYSDCNTYCDVGNDHNYTIPEGFTIALVEDGIRSYDNGYTRMDGVNYTDHNTSNITVQNCTVQHARGGITLVFQSGYVQIEDCTTIGCDRGIATGASGVVERCYSDFQYGMAYNVDYSSGSSQTVDITLIDADLPTRINGYVATNNNGYTDNELPGVYVWPSEDEQMRWSEITGIDYSNYANYQEEGTRAKVRQIAFIHSHSHDLTFRADNFSDEFYAARGEYIFKIGGDEELMTDLYKDDNYSAYNITMRNYTKFRVVLDADSYNNTIYSWGPVEDYGSGNTVIYVDENGNTI